MAEFIDEAHFEQVDEQQTEDIKTDAEILEEECIKNTKSIEDLVKEVIVGLHGSGRERMLSLGENYEAVQHEVNQLIKKGDVK